MEPLGVASDLQRVQPCLAAFHVSAARLILTGLWFQETMEISDWLGFNILYKENVSGLNSNTLFASDVTVKAQEVIQRGKTL